MNLLISKIFALVLIVAGVVLEVIWVTFLFGSVLGIVLLLIFAPWHRLMEITLQMLKLKSLGRTV